MILPKRPFEPLFLIGGYSTNASIAADGDHVAFLNRRTASGRTRFNLAIADRSGKVTHYIEARELGFSRPVFVNQSIVANELLQDHYEVREYNLAGEELRTIFRVDHSVKALKQLPRVSLSLSN